ncbi:MAG: hypothetical protein HUU35_13215, partial [Armatimonadetes bacterium]|nr:hypothetical protein [Armatimonadota bacterium]
GLTEQGPWWGRVTPGEPPRVELLPGAPPDPALPTDIGNGHFAGFWHSKWQVGEVPAAAGGS